MVKPIAIKMNEIEWLAPRSAILVKEAQLIEEERPL